MQLLYTNDIEKDILQIKISDVWFLINNVTDDRTKNNLPGFFLYYKKVNDFFDGLFLVLSTATRRHHFFRSSFFNNEYFRTGEKQFVERMRLNAKF